MARAAGSQTTATTVPKWQEDAAKAALARSNQVAGIGYTPYYGPDVAAMTPMQMSAMEGTNQAASAFGMPTTDLSMSMPVAQDFGGIQGYSSGGLYDQALAELKARNPEQYAAIMDQFNPKPLQMANQPVPTPTQTPMPMKDKTSSNGRRGDTAQKNIDRIKKNTDKSGGGFTSVRDMFDGGGAGKSGSTFKGGPLSKKLNKAGVKPAKPRAKTASGKGR